MTTAALSLAGYRRRALRPDLIRSDSGPLAPVALDAPLRQLHAYWRSLAGPGDLPQRCHVEPFEIRDLLRDILLLQAVEDGADFEFRIAGDRIETVAGRSIRGARLGDLAGSAPGRERVLRDYRAVLETGEPHYRRDRMSAIGGQLPYRRLLLPLYAGGTLTHIMGAMLFEGA
ncbi:MAG TPA: PAS domain-containing protein [Azospirillaceae bacterium]|nr:PAS domain-containing protein [Azospirillaceae bacterium]